MIPRSVAMVLRSLKNPALDRAFACVSMRTHRFSLSLAANDLQSDVVRKLREGSAPRRSLQLTCVNATDWAPPCNAR